MARGNTKPAAKAKPKSTARRPEGPATSGYAPRDIPLLLQQRCLDIFRDTFLPDGQDPTVLQKVKGHLYDRNFAAAFGKEEYLQVYASRWSPSRALGYVQILTDVSEFLMPSSVVGEEDDESMLRVICLGGGAGAEVVALAGWRHLQGDTGAIKTVDADFLDIASWGAVVEDLHKAATTPPELSKYASAAAREANTALVSGNRYISSFEQVDALQLDEQKCELLFRTCGLVMLMFTLNELYSMSIPKTQQMLSHLTLTIKRGACLLIVDSPGSYSAVPINGAEKKYPMQWLVDYTLIGSPQKQKDARPKWEKLVSDDSRWFRLSQGLKYPIGLENMRYQIHLYRRLDEEAG